MNLASRIVGIGVDIVPLARVKGMVARHGAERLSRRLLAPGPEAAGLMRLLEEFQADGRPGSPPAAMQARSGTIRVPFPEAESKRIVSYVAGCFAAKEATYKAAFPAALVNLREVALVRPSEANERGTGKPLLHLSPALCHQLGLSAGAPDQTAIPIGVEVPKPTKTSDCAAAAPGAADRQPGPCEGAHVSLSHDGGMVVAMVVLEARGE
ncbi:hypothetical protein H696_03431 [Fonticula alba]|uniref:4'-phosphopantetheinyl transferase domain-containing protein n=1 Tax=Fonticula alba TaxID=691883 RepID=A0A058Z7B3_FONAL|nr:hypothetical protein H696_03431 [Fonticula alba]KCV69966.1 hypothetical protein H696_03431 [Fonticula alba]|eukprot:XP_009495572.1 hypothetical protein H696_03431 [Fonticula alba]